jgi:protein O-GlcNAc transferase
MDMTTTQQKMQLAIEHFASGRVRDTEALCRQILHEEPNHAEALHLFGVLANQVGHRDAAIDLIRRAVALSPQTAEYHSNLAVILTTRGRVDEAIASCRQALALQPELAEAHYNLGNALRAAGQPEAAATAYRQAIKLKPDYPHAHNNLGNVARAMGDFDTALAAYREALFAQPDYAHARSNLGNALKDLGRIDEAIEVHRQAVATAPSAPEVHSNLLWSLYYSANSDGASILEESRRWDQVHADPLRGSIRPLDVDRSPDRTLRIGYISPDLRLHSAAFFLTPLLEAHDSRQYHVTCYSTSAQADAVTERLRSSSDEWRSVAGMPDEVVAQRIRDDRIDILVDLSAHTAGNRLPVFARKPAPLQVTYLAFTGTTGLAAIDYRLTDARVDPPGEKSLGTERPIRLPDTAWCFSPLTGSPEVSPLPALKNGYVTFGCYNNIAKVTPHVLYLWARILQQVDASRLALKSVAFRSADAMHRIREFFSDYGIDPARLELLPDERDPLLHFQSHAALDIALDTFPFEGLATTCLALWMGVPVVSYAGQTHMTRVGYSLLSSVGLPELAASSYDGYVQTAAQMAGDLTRLSDLRAGLRQRMQSSVLMDATRFARNVEAAYRGIWHEWCERT